VARRRFEAAPEAHFTLRAATRTVSSPTKDERAPERAWRKQGPHIIGGDLFLGEEARAVVLRYRSSLTAR